MSSRSSSNSRPPKSIPGYYCVGYVRSAHGIRGELGIALFAGKADWLDLADELSLLPRSGEGSLRAFAIDKARPHKDGLIALLEGLSSRNEAELWKGAQVYVPEELLTAEPGEAIYLRQIQGFDLADGQGHVLGRIFGFSTNGSQDLLRVDVQGREVLVPFIDEFILSIEMESRQVRMDLPPGLLNPEGE